MQNILWKWILILLMAAASLQAQVFSEIVDISAPNSATGSSNLATIDNVWSVYVNPAGLSRIDGLQFAAGVQRPHNLNFLFQQAGVIALPLSSRFGSIALGFHGNAVKYNDVTLTAENAYSLTHALYLQKDLHSSLAVGYNLNLYHVRYGTSAGPSGDGSDGMELGNGYGVGVNLGVQASLRERSWIGLVVKNINNPQLGSAGSAAQLPKSLAVGFGYEPYYGLKTNFMVYQSLSLSETQYRAGLDYRLFDWLSLRAGVNTSPNRIGCGFGIYRWGFGIDYAFISHPVLPETHQFAVGYRYNK